MLALFKNSSKIVIGMLHLPALPGSPKFDGNLEAIREMLLTDADALVTGGIHGLMIENFGDVPFYPDRVPAHVVAQITSLAGEVKRQFPQIPLGINVLRNDGRSALAVAHAIGAQYVRVNVLSGTRVTDQGVIQGIAHDLMRDRMVLGASDIKVFADVDVKHSAPLAPRAIEDEVDDTIERGLADAVIVSGAGTGKPTDPKHVQVVKHVARDIPVFIGSGITSKTVRDFLAYSDGFIVGSWFKRDGDVSNPVDAKRVRELINAIG